MVFRGKFSKESNFEDISEININDIKLSGQKIIESGNIKHKIKLDEVKIKVQKQVKDKKMPDKVKVRFNKYKVKNDVKVNLAFNSAKQKNKIRTEFFFKESFRKIRRYAVSGLVTAAMAIGICAVINSTGYRLGSEVIIDGETIGLVSDQAIVYAAIESVKNDLTMYSDGSFDYEKEPTFIGRIIGPNDSLTVDDIRNTLMSKVDYLVQGYGIYVDNELHVAVVNEEAANYVLSQHKNKFVGDRGGDGSVVEFDRPVEIKSQFVPVGILRTAEGAIRTLSTPVKKEFDFLAGENDSLWSVAKAYDITVDRIKELNPSIGDAIAVGSTVKIEANAPLLGVKFTRDLAYNQEIPYDTQKVDDPDLYKGRMKVVEPGANGESHILAKITEINGIEVNRSILAQDTVSQPKTQIENHGTKEPPRTLATGTFMRPAYGSLSSRYGARWGREHKGIDIAGSHGSDVKAADGGIVTFSGWESGYGYFVVIDHENGYQTAYGHNSENLVSKGERIAKGDVIAKMGNTGNSTGTHVHFEVRVNGSHVNPASYVGY